MDTTKLKLALAKELPELILYRVGNEWSRPYHTEGFYWEGEYDEYNHHPRITDREWDWVVRQVVGKLTPEQFINYVFSLRQDNAMSVRNAQFMSWEVRAVNYFKVIGKSI